MKKTIQFLVPAVMLFVFTACSDEKENNQNSISAEEAAEAVAEDLATETQGVTLQMGDAIMFADGLEPSGMEGGRLSQDELACGEEVTKSFERSNPEGSAVISDFSFAYIYMLTCDENSEAQSLSLQFSREGAVDAPRFSSEASASGNWILTGLESTSDVYTFNGSYQKQAFRASKVREEREFSHTIDKSMTDLNIDKETKTIQSGVSTFTISGTSRRGSFEYSGTITYLGNGKADVSISGEKYTADLISGEIE